MTDWYVRGAAALPFLWLAHRFPIQRENAWRRLLLVHLPAAWLYVAAKVALCVWVFGAIDLLPDPGFEAVFMDEFDRDLLTYAVAVGAVHAWDHLRRLREREQEAARLALRASQLQAELSEAQLGALKAQLQPHFLFNTLNSISALIHEDSDAADQMVEQLSDFLRLVVENAGAQEVPLRRELLFLERYLAIQRTRFADRLRVTVEVDPDVLDAWVPNLLLQPLVENAIRHAVEPRAAGGAVDLRATREDGALCLEVRDDGPGLGSGPSGGTGVGLANTRPRLQHLYGDGAALELQNCTGGGLITTIRLPLRADVPTCRAGRTPPQGWRLGDEP